MKFAFLMAALAGTMLAAGPDPVRVRIIGASGDAQETLWARLQERGPQQGVSFERVNGRPDYTLMVSWRQNWLRHAPPSASIVAFEGESTPLFAVECDAPFKKSWALGRCAGKVVQRLAARR